MKNMRLRERDTMDHILYMASLSLVSVTVVAALVLANVTPAAYADNSSISTATVRVSQSCSMTATTDTPHTAELHNGIYSGTTYTNGIGKTTLKAFCNDSTGFAIYAIGYTGDEFGNTKLHSAELGDSFDINTGIYTSSTTVNSTWSMKLSSVSGDFAPTIVDGTNNEEDFTTWHEVPNEYTKVAYRTTGTDILVNNQGTGSSVEVTYDAYISATQPAGTYIGQVKYTLVHPNTAGKPVAPLKDSDCPAGNVCYAPNASDIVGSMSSLGSITSSPTAGKISVGTDATEINLIAPNYKREGYGFAGWSTDFTATNASTIYGPNETLTVPSGTLATKGMILYPVWVASAGDLQGWTGCSNANLTQATYDSTNHKMVATLSSVTALTDTRDGNVYAVAKLADGKCWMIENLRLDNTADFNPAKSQGFGGTFSALPASTDSWTNDNVLPQLNTNNTNIGGKNASNTNLTPGYNTTNTDTAQWYSYGNYYSWAAAIADTRAYDSYNGHTTVETSLCPAGWHLPYGNDGNSSPNLGNTAGGFYYLNAQMANDTSDQGSKDLRSFPNNFVYSGWWGGARADGRSSDGYYWSSSAYNSRDAYYLNFTSSNVYPGTNVFVKFRGRSIRCISQ